jgi:ParB family chromosome partitioning protein
MAAGSTMSNDARLWEIAENLHRAELTFAERAEHVAEWIAITN